jgi:hypothetical protein
MSEQMDKLVTSLNTNLKKILESVKDLNERLKNKEFEFENVNFNFRIDLTLILIISTGKQLFNFKKYVNARIFKQCVVFVAHKTKRKKG